MVRPNGRRLRIQGADSEQQVADGVTHPDAAEKFERDPAAAQRQPSPTTIRKILPVSAPNPPVPA